MLGYKTKCRLPEIGRLPPDLHAQAIAGRSRRRPGDHLSRQQIAAEKDLDQRHLDFEHPAAKLPGALEIVGKRVEVVELQPVTVAVVLLQNFMFVEIVDPAPQGQVTDPTLFGRGRI